MSDLGSQLNETLSTTFSFYVRAHGFHWNVEGPCFLQYHELFGKIASDVYGSIDQMAEELRAIGRYAPSSLTELKVRSAIVDDQNAQNINAKSMVSTLLTENDTVLASLHRTFSAAEDANNQGLVDFLASRIDAHMKWKWFLTASNKA